MVRVTNTNPRITLNRRRRTQPRTSFVSKFLNRGCIIILAVGIGGGYVFSLWRLNASYAANSNVLAAPAVPFTNIVPITVPDDAVPVANLGKTNKIDGTDDHSFSSHADNMHNENLNNPINLRGGEGEKKVEDLGINVDVAVAVDVDVKDDRMGRSNNSGIHKNLPTTTAPHNQPTNQGCHLYDGRGNVLEQQMMPPDGTVIFTVTAYGEARLKNVMHMLTNLLVEGELEQPKSPSPQQRLGMIAVSGNKTLLPVLQALSQENATALSSMVLVADLQQDYGPLTRVVSADACFTPSRDYVFVVGDDDVVYNRDAVFVEVPDMLQRVQHRLNNEVAMVGYIGIQWNYPLHWPRVNTPKGGQYEKHVSDRNWKKYRNQAIGLNRTVPFCAESTEPPSTSTLTSTTKNISSVCEDILQTGILECYGLVAFHRTAVNPQLYQRHHHPDFPQSCFWGDDLWLAYYAFRMNISMYVMKSRVANPATVLLRRLPQPDGSVGNKEGGNGNLGNYQTCGVKIVNNEQNCSWSIC